MSINKLIDPNEFQHPLDISTTGEDLLISLLKKMYYLRAVEDHIAYAKEKNLIVGPVHLGAGQEAISTAIAQYIDKDDSVFGTHRSHLQLLAMGTNLNSFFCEILARANGLSGGMGGSMHMIDKEIGFSGCVPIVAGTVPLAVGAGLANKMKSNNKISVAFFGDGAVEEGVVHESFNLAQLYKIPILFVIENNLYASHMDIDERQTSPSMIRFGIANNIESYQLDGNNILDLVDKFKYIISSMRSSPKPVIVELITFRHYGHVDWRRDIDVGINRSKDSVDAWMKRDPIHRLEKALIDNNIITEKEVGKHIKEEKIKINSIWEECLKEKAPLEEDLLNNVYYEE